MKIMHFLVRGSTILAVILIALQGSAQSIQSIKDLKPDDQVFFQSMLEEANQGVLGMLPAEDVKDVVTQTVYFVNEGKGQEKKVEQKKWKAEELPFLADAMAKYFVKYNLTRDGKKDELLKKHLKKFAAFKASVYSSYPPSPEMGNVVGGEIVRGVRWVLDPSYSYPSDEDRETAKSQITDLFAYLENSLKQRYPDAEFATLIQEEVTDSLESFLWRIDSPFFVHGKKVLTPEQMEQIKFNMFVYISKTAEEDLKKLPARLQKMPESMYGFFRRNLIQGVLQVSLIKV